jgi:hypothetical protein
MRTDRDPITLLQRFEPILRFTKGECFFPIDVDGYVDHASLWVKSPHSPPREIVSEPDLDLRRLGKLRLSGADEVHYLQFISPMNIREIAEYQISQLREGKGGQVFRPSRSRLARVGYLARLLDVIFSLILLLRGRVPGDTATAALVTFEEMLSSKREFLYYGRVIRQNGWLILQYWYFYPFNNWRSGFFGANDHEADWEMVNLYCYEGRDGNITPEWVAYARHNDTGDDLRRHWDDPAFEKVGEHPVVYVGGGSHASYFQPGEYLTQLSLPFLKPLRNIQARILSIIRGVFQENDGRQSELGERFSIPFVDYALGDGLCIGYGGDETWADPVLIDPEPPWVKNYRGLWGLYANDPFSGEDAPAGPRYNRDGSVRLQWFDPLSWAGMQKLIPPDWAAQVLAARKGVVQEAIQSLKAEIGNLQEITYQLGIDLAAIREAPHLQTEVNRIEKALNEDREHLMALRERLTVKQAVLEALEDYSDRTPVKRVAALREHIRNPHQPEISRNLRFPVLAEIWAAVSIGILMIAVVLLVIFARQLIFWGLSALFLVMITIEAAFRRRLSDLVRWMAVGLATVGLFILLFEFFWIFALVALMAAGSYMIIENLRELFTRR